MPDWFDPLGLRDSIRDPLAALGGAARMVNPTGQSLNWVLTTVARRLRGRRMEIRGEPLIKARVAEVREVVPSTTIPIPGVSRSIALWERVAFSVDEVEVGDKPIELVEVVASDIRIADPTAQTISVGRVEMTVSLSHDDLDCWIRTLGIDVEFDLATGTAEVQISPRMRWLRVVGEPTLSGRRVELRASAIRLGRVRVPLPARLVKPRSHELHHVPEALAITGMRLVDGLRVEIGLEGSDVDVALDIPRVITDIGVEGTMSMAKVLRL